MPSEFRETAEDLNTTESVQVDGNAIRRRVDAFTGSDHYRFTIDGIEYDAHWAHDTRRLLDENTRLNTALDEVRSEASRLYRSLQQTAKRVEDDRDALAATVEALSARLTAKNAELDKVIREAAADKARLAAIERFVNGPTTPERAAGMSTVRRFMEGAMGLGDPEPCQWAELSARRPAPEMPRPPAEEAAWSDADRVCAFDGCGESCRHDEENPVPPAQKPVSGPETAGTGSGRGTGVTEAPETTQDGEEA